MSSPLIIDVKDRGYLVFDKPPLPLLGIISCEGVGRENPTSRCYCVGHTVFKVNEEGMPVKHGLNMPICSLRRYYDVVEKLELARNGKFSDKLVVIDQDEFDAWNSGPMGPLMVASSTPMQVGPTGDGNNPAPRYQIFLPDTPPPSFGQGNVMTSGGNNEGQQYSPPAQPTLAPVNKMCARHHGGEIAHSSGTHDSVGGNGTAKVAKKVPLRRARARGEHQLRKKKGDRELVAHIAADREEMRPAEPLLGVFECEGIGQKTPTSICYCVGRAVHRTNENGLSELVGYAMPLCTLKRCYNIKEDNNAVFNINEVVVKVEGGSACMMVLSNRKNPVRAGTSQAGNTGNGNSIMQVNPEIFKEPTYMDLVNGAPLVPLIIEGYRQRNAMKRPGMGDNNEAPVNKICSRHHGGEIAHSSGTHDSVDGNGAAKVANQVSLQGARACEESLVKRDAGSMTEIWLAHLCSFPGVEREKAVGISKIFEGPKKLFDAYRRSSSETGRNLLANIEYTVGLGIYARTEIVGRAASEVIHDLFTFPPEYQDEVSPKMG